MIIKKDWYPSRYICVFLLGVVCALVGNAKAHDPEITRAIENHARAIQQLTTAIQGMKCR